MRTSRQRIAISAAVGLGLALTGVSAISGAPASANPAGTGLVISEVYGGGGNSNATYNADFIELYNPTSADISLNGDSLQYRAAATTTASTNIFTLPNAVVPAGDHYLVSGAGGATGAALPTANATSTLNLSGTAGQVILANQTAGLALPAGSVSSSAVIDFVGYGTAGTYEGAGAAPATTNPSSVARTAQGADTDNNKADLTVANPPTPTAATGSTTPPTGGGGTTPTAQTIAQIQGTNTATSPDAGVLVTTTGVVTADYATGGFAGFYLQTGGTGGATDATPGASDGVFVYGTSTDNQTVGSSVTVTGTVAEFKGTTEINTAAAGDVTALTPALAPVTPLAAAYPTTEATREAHEGELLAPTDTFTVTDNYSTNQYGEIGLATGGKPLIQPTDVADAQDTGAIAAVVADNAARSVYLDDGASTNYLAAANTGTPLPWLTLDNHVRAGSTATLHAPVVLEYRNTQWNLQPQTPVTDDGSAVATFSDTRTAAPGDVGGDIRLATFNVLNYFPTTGADYAASSGNACSYYNDRAGNPITVNSCDTSSTTGPRGAADQANFTRQQNKIVAAINKLGASIVSLEEIENSVKFGKDRDSGVSTLVTALNAAAGAGTWSYVPSPPASQLPALAEQDVIRTAFIYKSAAVTPVGDSRVLVGSAAFSDAREPLAQAWKAVGAPSTQKFAVIVNHFKSKGSGTDDGTGQGLANPDRVNQATDLNTFASTFASDSNLSAVFFTGDFNSYTQEDPLQVLYADGYANTASTVDPGEATYYFDGLNGSLDHVLANSAAKAMITGADVWNINAEESVAYEYSRYNANATDLYAPDQFRASDHDPDVVGLDLSKVPNNPDSSTTAATTSGATYGTAGSVAVTVTPSTATGTVTVSNGSTTLGTAPLSGGAATVAIGATALAPGTYSLTVAYGGDTSDAASMTTVSYTVAKAASTVKATTTGTTSPADGSVNATVTPSGATGTVTVSNGTTVLGSATLSGGTAAVTVPGSALTPGNYTLTVAYSGDGTYLAGSTTVAYKVLPTASVTLNLLNINDFHGRIDPSITTQWATTIEKLRAQGGAANTLLLSAGDNIGASLFASASEQDNPTIDVLNALGLDTSAVGNHEFDQGFADLEGHVNDRADWKYLGANVYDKGTTTPALQTHKVFVVNGLRVAVIGAVTQETPSLVSPAGITGLDFGDPVDAVNRVAGELTDGDPSNGEADVILAEYHEGAPAGDVEGATLASNETNSAVFTKIVDKTSPEVAAIFTGHTHKKYAYVAPVPGATDGSTRPIIQTGNYGDFVGHVTLTVDRASDTVTAHTQENVAKAAQPDLTYPVVQQVKQITDKALDDAAALGNQPVGTITADITTAFSGGSFVNGVYTGGTRDDRASESTLGDLVANALRDGVSDFGNPDLGITNPGGLRAELTYAGDTSNNAMNTDGTVTYAEANSVLPFNNTIALVKLTGASIKTILEQQYQTAADGTIPTRPYLQLGLSDNVRVTTDPSLPAGSRITSVYISGQPLDPAKTYTVSTVSFLATGGDNFRAFTQGTYVDTGLIDATLFRNYFAANPGLKPDFARQQVTATNLPTSIKSGDAVSFTLSTLDLTSLGSPANTSIVGTITSGGQTIPVGTFPVTGGSATIAFTVPAGITQAGELDLVAAPSGTTVTVPVTGSGTTTPPTETTVAGTTSGTTYGTAGSVAVTVTPTDATGTVAVLDGTTPLGMATLTGGSAAVSIGGTALAVGSHSLTVEYLGDATHAASQSTVTYVVRAAAPVATTITVAQTPKVVHAGRTKPTFVVTVLGADKKAARGTIKLSVSGKGVFTGTLTTAGKYAFHVPVLKTVGNHKCTVAYTGSGGDKSSTVHFVLKVVT